MGLARTTVELFREDGRWIDGWTMTPLPEIVQREVTKRISDLGIIPPDDLALELCIRVRLERARAGDPFGGEEEKELDSVELVRAGRWNPTTFRTGPTEWLADLSLDAATLAELSERLHEPIWFADLVCDRD